MNRHEKRMNQGKNLTVKYLRKKTKKKRFNAFICRYYIKIALFHCEISSQIKGGMAAKVF